MRPRRRAPKRSPARRPTPPRRPTKPRPPQPQRRARRRRSLRPCASWNGSRLAPTPSSPSRKKCSPPPRPTRTRRAPRNGQKAAAKAADLGTQLEAAKADAKAKLDAAAAAKDALKAAEAKRTETAAAARDAKLALEPVSVFISRKTKKLYVRRGFATIEVPIAIRDPDKPIGTHIFTAVARTDSGLRWTAVTIDDGDNAKDALDRITIPQDVLDRIAPTAAPRTSLIISDEPPNREQNYRTEFVVVLNNQPQGGLAIRKPASDIVARDGLDGYYGYGYARQYSGPYGGTSYYYQRW